MGSHAQGKSKSTDGMHQLYPVIDDFCQSYNIVVIIRCNPTKPCPINKYRIDQENGSAATFVRFITALIISGFFKHEENLVIDNMRIHTGGEADGIKTLLWETLINGRPMYVIIVYLPTRSPKPNPIEFIFHILTVLIHSFRYQMDGPCDKIVKEKAK
jgi:hypothetical protein